MDYKATKEIAQALDKAAERCEFLDKTPATGKQVWFLASLIQQAGEDAKDIGCCITNTKAVLTKRRASMYIEMYLESKKEG